MDVDAPHTDPGPARVALPGRETLLWSFPWRPVAGAGAFGLLLLLIGAEFAPTTRLGLALQFLGKTAIVAGPAGSLIHMLLVRRLGSARVLRLYFRFAAIGLSLCTALVIGEFALRAYYHDVTTSAKRTSWFSQRWFRNSPPQRNALGFRERDFSPTPAPGVYRIAFIGDSFAYGQGIPEADRMSNLLEAELNARGGAYEVLNFGVAGSETKEQLVTLFDAVFPSRPHAVVQQWYTNDVRDWEKSGPDPAPMRLIPSDFLSGVLHRHSVLYYLIDNQWTNWQSSWGLLPSGNTRIIAQYRDPASPESVAARQRQIQFIEACRERSLPLSVVLFPQLTDSLGNDYSLNFLMDRMDALLEAYDVPHVDLRHALSQVHPVSDLWVNTFDWHPNRRANAIATDLLVEAQADTWAADRARRVASSAPDDVQS